MLADLDWEVVKGCLSVRLRALRYINNCACIGINLACRVAQCPVGCPKAARFGGR